jgi:DNA primase
MDLKEQVRQANPIEDLAIQYTTLKPQGKALSGLCPFHSESHASFAVYPESQSWWCYGCNKGGDVFSFVMLKECLSFAEALRFLARRANIPLPELSPEKLKQLEEQQVIENALTGYC